MCCLARGGARGRRVGPPLRGADRLGAIGLVTALYLVYVEIVRLHALCEWCTAVHVLTLLSFLVAVYRAQHRPAVALSDDRPD